MVRTRRKAGGVETPAAVARRPARRIHGRTLACGLAAALAGQVAAQPGPDPGEIERGRYLVLIGHCNNCHTAGYAAASGQVDETRWLTGNPIGWRSRQGTSYAINLRLYLQNLGVDDWLAVARNARSRAPMPWWSLRETREADLRAMYAYIRSLTPLGEPAPAFQPGE